MSSDDDGPVDEGSGTEVLVTETQTNTLARFIKLLKEGPSSAWRDASQEGRHTAGGTASTPEQPGGQISAAERAMLSHLDESVGLPAPSLPQTDPMPSSAKQASRIDELRTRARANFANAASGPVKNLTRTPVFLSLSTISETRVTNIRIQEDEAAFASLRDSLQRDGQLQEIVVVADRHREDRYSVVAGFRRYHGAVALGWPCIRAIVLPAGTDDQELLFLNAIENAQRFKLSGFEIASRAQLMRDEYGTPLAEYARRLGRSDSRVQNQVRYLEHLPPDVLKAWRDGDPLLTHLLGRLAKMPPEEASEFWNAWRFRHAELQVRPHSSRSAPRRSQNRPTSAMLSRLWLVARRAEHLDENTRELAVAIIDFCMGNAATVPGFFDPREPSATPNRRRKSARAKEREQSDRELDCIDQDGEIVLPPLFPGDGGLDDGSDDHGE